MKVLFSEKLRKTTLEVVLVTPEVSSYKINPFRTYKDFEPIFKEGAKVLYGTDLPFEKVEIVKKLKGDVLSSLYVIDNENPQVKS